MKEGLNSFKRGNGAVFFKPRRVVNANINGTRIDMTCKSQRYLNRVVNTHETIMNQSQQLDSEDELFHVRIDFWSDNIFRVRFSRDAIQDVEADFPPPKARMLTGSQDRDVRVRIIDTEETIDASTTRIRLSIDKGSLHIKAFSEDGSPFWSQYRPDYVAADVFDISVSEQNGRIACFESFSIGNKEEIYGLGERFDSLGRRGRPVDFWNKDAIGTNNARSYINVPFLLSTKGYGLFLNSSARTEWEIGTLEASSLGFAAEEKAMDYFIIYGPTPSEILSGYCGLTGFAPVPPIWSFGLWMSRNSYTSWDVVNDVARTLREKTIPCDVLHLDTFWFAEDFNCDLRFSKERFPEPESHMKALREIGFRTSLWQYNFVPPRENNANYVEGLEKGYFALGRDGKPYALPEGAVGSWLDDCIIDFSNPEAARWYAEQIRKLIGMGAATIKTDFGEGIPEDAVYQNIEGNKFHNLYSLVYNSVVAEAIHDVTGEHIVWARSGTAGSQRYPIHWGGDSVCNFQNLSGTLRAALSLGLSGFPFFSHDIGGFIGNPSPELYVRWAQFGLFSSHSRCHGAGNDNSREPWAFGDDAERIFRNYAKLRYKLLPYIYNEAVKCCRTGKPMVRALVIEYPGDRNVYHIEDEYLFGDFLLIAPVLQPLEESQTRSLYLPEGKWTNYWTKAGIVSRGEWIETPVTLETMPMYVKEGGVLCYGVDKIHTGNEIGRIARVEVYGRTDGLCAYTDGQNDYKIQSDGACATVTGLGYQPEVTLFHF